MKRVLVIGAARSGIAVAKLLASHDYEVILTDQQMVNETIEGVQIVDGGHPDWLLNQAYDFVVKNPGIPYRVPIIQHFIGRCPIYTEIEVAYWFGQMHQYAAVTGTDGKTTVVSILYEMFKKAGESFLAGNIGIPLSEQVMTHPKPARVALELSNFQLMGIDTFKPQVATVTNLAADHLDYMDSLEDYYQSKMAIYQNMDENGVFIRNIDDENIVAYAQQIPCQVWDISLKQKATICVQDGWVMLKDEPLFAVNDIKLVGQFNLMNMMMASAMAYALGVSKEVIKQVVNEFRGVEHRIEYCGTINGVRFYNDSKATNTHAACAGLSAFNENVILLAGGKDKHISFDDLAIYDQRVKVCIAFGQTKEKISGIFTHSICVNTLELAFEKALSVMKEGDVVLLCPACSSFDQFVSYEQRGDVFKALVKRAEGK